MKRKITEVKRISNLVIFNRSGRNTTYLLNTEKKVRRIEQLAGDLLINGKATAKHGSSGERFNLIITSNIQ